MHNTLPAALVPAPARRFCNHEQTELSVPPGRALFTSALGRVRQGKDLAGQRTGLAFVRRRASAPADAAPAHRRIWRGCGGDSGGAGARNKRSLTLTHCHSTDVLQRGCRQHARRALRRAIASVWVQVMRIGHALRMGGTMRRRWCTPGQDGGWCCAAGTGRRRASSSVAAASAPAPPRPGLHFTQ